MLNPKVISNIALILEDTYKQIKSIATEREKSRERDDEEERERLVQNNFKELAALDTLS